MFGKIGLVILLYFFLRLDTFLNTKAKIQHLNSIHHGSFGCLKVLVGGWGQNLAKVVKGMEAVVGFGFKQELYQNFPGDPIYKCTKSVSVSERKLQIFFCQTISIPLSFCVLCFALLFCLGYFFYSFWHL